jgi:hypothetical protein
MWWWKKVHKADIPEDLRAKFELYGEEMIATVLATRKHEDYGDLSTYWPEAMKWLRERRDKKALREDRLETVEWALLIFAVVGTVAIIPTVANEVIWLMQFIRSGG